MTFVTTMLITDILLLIHPFYLNIILLLKLLLPTLVPTLPPLLILLLPPSPPNYHYPQQKVHLHNGHLASTVLELYDVTSRT